MFDASGSETTDNKEAYFIHIDSKDAIEDIEDMAEDYNMFYDDEPGWYMYDEHKRKYVHVDSDLVRVIQANLDLN